VICSSEKVYEPYFFLTEKSSLFGEGKDGRKILKHRFQGRGGKRGSFSGQFSAHKKKMDLIPQHKEVRKG